MQCGSKCFIVEFVKDGQTFIKPVTSRTPINARKVIRKKYGEGVQIISAVQKKDDA